MELAHILESHMNFKIRLSSSQMEIHTMFKGCRCRGELYFTFYRPSEVAVYAVSDAFAELEDVDVPNIKDDAGVIEGFRFRGGDMVYEIIGLRSDPKIAQAQPGHIENHYSEISSLRVLQRPRIGARIRNGYVDKYTSPELYMLKFKGGGELIIYYSESGPFKSIFFQEQDLLDELFKWKRLTLSDFELQPPSSSRTAK